MSEKKVLGNDKYALGMFYRWQGLAGHISDNVADWKRIYDSLEPQNEALPSQWSSRLDSFHKIVMLRLLRPDKV